jgi:hypothetical protein
VRHAPGARPAASAPAQEFGLEEFDPEAELPVVPPRRPRPLRRPLRRTPTISRAWTTSRPRSPRRRRPSSAPPSCPRRSSRGSRRRSWWRSSAASSS